MEQVAPLVLESGDIVKIQVATANKIEGMISYLEIFDEKGLTIHFFNVFMELVRILIQELEKVWGVVEKDIKNALAYSSQLTDSDFVYDLLKEGKFQL